MHHLNSATLLIVLLVIAGAAADQPAAVRKSRKQKGVADHRRRFERYLEDNKQPELTFDSESGSFGFDSEDVSRPRLQQAESKLNVVKTKLAGVRNEIGERAVGAAHKASKLLRELRGQ